MTRSRLLAAAALLLLGVACGRLGAPVRSAHPRAAAARSPALPGVEEPQDPADEEEVEKK
jgi:hypothetical protein